MVAQKLMLDALDHLSSKQRFHKSDITLMSCHNL